MTPLPALSSTHYCLANPGKEYLVYKEKSVERFAVELKTGAYHVEWFDPAKGESIDGGRTTSHEGTREFKPPFEGDAVLYLKADSADSKP